ncbi:aminotransferase class IV [Brucepastera parasyntrophica]|uniref:aminotransferase class IV n=1 Tax=Brucepastera parasyntrophica TaxID=2880008 RepID=UPI00210EED97|nr:aminotransferase class IV [Brucepastera parasyntrophica]ULQ60719.1 aminotransferase class IV [Brucepastera parasyntrophica]
MAFSLAMYPISYVARYNSATEEWEESWVEADSIPFEKLAGMSEEKRQEVLSRRNLFNLPLVNYTTQYGLGCFEGMKAYPRKDGTLTLFRPDRNAKRFYDSMRGLYAPGFPQEMFVAASIEYLKKNRKLGYIPSFDPEWEQENFSSAGAVYMRPFMYSEGAIGIGISKEPRVIICATTVSSYFKESNNKAIVTNRIRATPNGTGWIKCASNYVISALAKKEAEEEGFMEVIFLDAVNRKYVEEGSSSNIFFRMKNGELVTPSLGDTILPGITRESIIELAREEGVTVSERKISIQEVAKKCVECFVTGTAAGITPIESITVDEKEIQFTGGGELGKKLQSRLKGIQYGIEKDTRGWNITV